MSKQTDLLIQKFTPLSGWQIERIIGDVAVTLPDLPSRVNSVIKSNEEKYSSLISGYKSADNKLQFLNENLQNIAEFLRDCKLIGYQNEKFDASEFDANSFIVGADGVAVISAYLQNKEKNFSGHEVKVVKNVNLQTAKEGSISQKHINIFLAQNQIHDNLYLSLTQDLQAFAAQSSEQEFIKTYLIETFGTTGGNHFVSLTIAKSAGEKEPLIYLFDPSPAVVRNGLEAAQNSVALGWCSQLIINATIKKAFADLGLIFDNDKFFNNSEPLQRTPLSLCATFAYETAHEIANLSKKQLEEFLKHYEFASPYGGKTEMPINLDEMIAQNHGHLLGLDKLGVAPPTLFMSHFVDSSLKTRANQILQEKHVRKSGEVESVAQRIERYQTEFGVNEVTDQKTLRQKMGHLFEIIISDKFLEHATKAELLGASTNEVSFEGSPYFPKDKMHFAKETHEIVAAFDKILPRNKVNSASYDDSTKEVNLEIYLGNITGDKLRDLVRNANIDGFKIEQELIDLRENFVGVDAKLAQFQKINLIIPTDKFKEVKEKINGARLYEPYENQPFAPPKNTAPIEVEKVASFQQGLHQ